MQHLRELAAPVLVSPTGSLWSRSGAINCPKRVSCSHKQPAYKKLKQPVWLRHICMELGCRLPQPTMLAGPNLER